MSDLSFDIVARMMESVPKPRPLPLVVVGSDHDRRMMASLLPDIVPLLIVSDHAKEVLPSGYAFTLEQSFLRPIFPRLPFIGRPTIRKRVRRLRSSPRHRRFSGYVTLDREEVSNMAKKMPAKKAKGGSRKC